MVTTLTVQVTMVMFVACTKTLRLQCTLLHNKSFFPYVLSWIQVTLTFDCEFEIMKLKLAP